MNPIQVLMEEHRVIERALDALVGYADALARGEALPRSDLARLARFLREFADTCHHGKEEDILFREMEAHGMSASLGPLAVMLHEHTEGRRLTRELADLGAGEGVVPPEDRERIRNTARAYAHLLREHIQKEDLVLYPMADQVLPEDTWKSIETAFGHFRTHGVSDERAAELVASANDLAARYAAGSRA